MKIVICGGGTAGWLAAIMINGLQKNKHDITVIESTKIGIIGAGEGSTGHLVPIIKGEEFGCDQTDFMRESKATVKLGIVHKDWYKKGVTYTAPLDGTRTSDDRINTQLYHALLSDIPFHKTSVCGTFLENKKTNFWLDDDRKLQDDGNHAYHFDAHKVGKYFKKICLSRGVTHIDSGIVEVNVDEGGISSLLLEDGRTIDGDFFIDCTGFSRKLITALGIKWISYKKHLPVNSALTFFKQYEEGEEVQPYTLAWAHSAGWMWRIPTAERYGCGYVFDDNFINEDQAKREIEESLGHEINPNRTIKFDTGRLEKLWHKNCLALGLCAAFAEPLEATSIHSTIMQLYKFIFGYLQTSKQLTVNSGSEALYNKQMTMMYDDFRDFLVLHYQTSRDDSEFWRWINTGATRTENIQTFLEMSKTVIPKHHHFKAYFGSATEPLWNWIMMGLRKIDKNLAMQELKTIDADMTKIESEFELDQQKYYGKTLFTLKNNYFIKGI